DPMLVNEFGEDYHLTLGSPCVDTGEDTGHTVDDRDLDGNSRLSGNHTDMGAYELVAPVRYTMADVTFVLRLMMTDFGPLPGAAPQYIAWLDVNKSGPSLGKVDLLDAVSLLRKIV